MNATPVGQDYIPDFLALSYYAGNYGHRPARELPLEMQDTYVRLDAQIADLLDIIDRKVGLGNTVLFITSTGYADAEPIDDVKYRIPTGEFYIKRCSALLNMYLAAIYGEGQYVEAYHEQEIYLNHKLIEDKHLNLVEILNRSSEFLVQFSGVKDVYSSQRLMLGSWTPEIGKIKNRYNKACSGDLWVEILPGWTVARDHSLDSRVVRDIYASAPLFFFGWDVNPGVVHTPVKVGNVVSTLTHFMRIRAPNAAFLPPLTDIRK